MIINWEIVDVGINWFSMELGTKIPISVSLTCPKINYIVPLHESGTANFLPTRSTDFFICINICTMLCSYEHMNFYDSLFCFKFQWLNFTLLYRCSCRMTFHPAVQSSVICKCSWNAFRRFIYILVCWKPARKNKSWKDLQRNIYILFSKLKCFDFILLKLVEVKRPEKDPVIHFISRRLHEKIYT